MLKTTYEQFKEKSQKNWDTAKQHRHIRKIASNIHSWLRARNWNHNS